MATPSVLLRDDPLPGVRRLTLNRPEKRNALSNELRGAILAALQEADADPAVKVSILRGAGPCFSSGYDLSANNAEGQPFYSPGGPGQWARHVVESWFKIWDLGKPVIAQVHGYCLAGGTARLAKPRAAASMPVIASPVRNISIAERMPMSQGWNWLSGGLIKRVGGYPMRASSAT